MEAKAAREARRAKTKGTEGRMARKAKTNLVLMGLQLLLLHMVVMLLR